MSLIAPRRLYRTADDRIVPEGDPDAAFLFACEGDEISDADAKQYGLTKAALTGEPAEDKPAAPEKMADQPANKIRRPAENK